MPSTRYLEMPRIADVSAWQSHTSFEGFGYALADVVHLRGWGHLGKQFGREPLERCEEVVHQQSFVQSPNVVEELSQRIERIGRVVDAAIEKMDASLRSVHRLQSEIDSIKRKSTVAS